MTTNRDLDRLRALAAQGLSMSRAAKGWDGRSHSRAIGRSTPASCSRHTAAAASRGRSSPSARNEHALLVLLAPRLLERLDAVAREKEISRAALVALWLREKLDPEAT